MSSQTVKTCWIKNKKRMSLAQYEELPVVAAPKWERVPGMAVKFFVTVSFQSQVKPSCARAAVRIPVSNYGLTYSMNLL